jgi:hypothetical protein
VRTRGVSLRLFFFTAVALVAPEPHRAESVGVLFGAVTFVFATMSGFFLTRLNHRFDTVRNEISAEDANFLSLYYFSKIVGEQVHDHMRRVIDEYYITVFEHPLNRYHKPTAKIYRELYGFFTHGETVAVRDQHKGIYESVAEILTDIEKRRNVIARAGEERLSGSMWAVVLVLALLVIITIFFLRDGTLFFDVAAVLLSTTVVVIVAVMRDLEDFRLGGVPLALESGYEMFEALGLPRYIPEAQLASGKVRIPRSMTHIRVGRTDPTTGERHIETVATNTLPSTYLV